MPEVDEDLKTGVKNAKSKRCYFAFIQKSASDGTLLIDKAKVADKDITAAKKKRGGSTTLKGACFGEEGKLVFELAKEPPDKVKLEEALNKVVKRDAGISIDALVRKGNAPDLIDDSSSGNDAYGVQIPVPENPYGVEIPVPNDASANPRGGPQTNDPYGVPIPVPNQPSANPPGGPQEEEYNNQDYNNVEENEGPSTQTVAPKSGNGAPVAQTVKQPPPKSGPTKEQIYYDKRKVIEPKVKEGLKQKRGDSAKLKEVFKYAEGCAKKKDFDKGIQGLDSLSALLAKPSPPQKKEDGLREYLARRKPIEPRLITALKAGLGKLGERLATTFKVAEGRSKKEDFSIAMEALGAVENMLRGVGVNPQGQSNGANPPSNSPEPTQNQDTNYNVVINSSADIDKLKQDELNALLDQTMDPTQFAAEMAMQIDEIDSDWANDIDLTNAKVDFPSDAKHGSFGKLGFIETGDPNTPKLVVKVPLQQAGSADLQREAEMYRKVGEHPNVAKCMGVTQVDGHRGLVMENIEGDNVTKTMYKIEDAYKSGNISHEEYWGIVQFMMREMLKGMAQLEQAGIVHNDIRGDNIMVDQNTGSVKIIDFGLSVESGNPAPNFPVKSGTTSPDVVSTDGKFQGPVDPKHDAFAVGSMTYKAGEGQDFDYNQPMKPYKERLPAFASFGPQDQVAIRPGDQQTSAASKNQDGTFTKTPGRAAANTSYTDFVNRMMDPDPTKRLSPADALNDPFLADSPIDAEAAAKLISNLMTKGTNPDRNMGPDPNNPKHPRPQSSPQQQQPSTGQQQEEEGGEYNITNAEDLVDQQSGNQTVPPQQNPPVQHPQQQHAPQQEEAPYN